MGGAGSRRTPWPLLSIKYLFGFSPAFYYYSRGSTGDFSAFCGSAAGPVVAQSLDFHLANPGSSPDVYHW